MPPPDHMTDHEILDAMREMIQPFAKLGERVARVETKQQAAKEDQGRTDQRVVELEKGQAATRLRIAYIAGAASVGTAVVSWLLEHGAAAAMGTG